MTDLNPCPSCGEPLDHPSGDGCANMTAHKERDVGDEELIARLRDAVNGEHDMTPHGADVMQAADRIEALTKERDRFEAALGRACLVGGTTYLIEQRDAANARAKEAEAYAEELERDLKTCRMAQAVMDNTVAELERERDEARKYRDAYAECDRIGTQAVRDLEAKLAKAVEAAEQLASDAVPCVCNYCLEARATLAEIKGESHEALPVLR